MDAGIFEEWLLSSGLVFREGATYTWAREVDGSSASLSPSLQYKLAMAAPVRQGVLERGVTKVYVSAPAAGEEATSEENIPTIPDGDLDGQLEPDASGSEAGEFEIGEDFLAGSVLRTLSLTSPPGTPPNGALTNGITNGAPHTNTGLHLAQPERTYKAHPLQRRISAFEDECAVYVRTSELSRIGVLDGDWVCYNVRSSTGVLGLR